VHLDGVNLSRAWFSPSSTPSIQNSTRISTPESPKPLISASGRSSMGTCSPLITRG
jgi:hypothetical protein